MATSVATANTATMSSVSPTSAAAFKRECRLRSLSGSIDVDYASDTVQSRGSSTFGQDYGLSEEFDRVNGTFGITYKETRSLPINKRMDGTKSGLSLLECRRRVSSPPQLAPSLKDLNDLRIMDASKALEFQDLPDPCKSKVFSFLSTLERGIAAATCRNWSELMRHPSLWSVVDLTVFPACTTSSNSSGCSTPLAAKSLVGKGATVSPVSPGQTCKECTVQCYHGYRARVTKFLRYLISIKPAIHVFRFSLDIGDPEDGWKELLQELIKISRCKEMILADLTWTETPAKKPFLPDTSVTWSNSDYKELTFRRRHRQRLFVSLFDLFTAMAPNLTYLRLPFDWSERSRQVIGRLHNLQVLDLRKYFQYGRVEPDAVHALVQSAQCLRSLTLELWNETYGGFSHYKLTSNSLQYLDVSACRGVYFSELSLPKLTEFRVARSPMSFHVGVVGSGVAGDPLGDGGVDPLPCMYDVLCRGVRGLKKINEFKLCDDWTEECSTEFERLLSAVCSCRQHKSASDENNDLVDVEL